MADIVELIPYGHENAISRKELSAVSGLRDRKMREEIEKATRGGEIIINLDSGYFRYKDERDLPYLEAYYNREMARGWSNINKCRAIRKFINGKKEKDMLRDNQISIFDFMNN